MVKPVDETVHFNVNLHCMENDGKHIAVTLETGIITVGDTQQEATEAAERWNVFIVAEAKQTGRRALRKFLDARGIKYQFDSVGVPQRMRRGIVAAQNVPLAAMVDTSGDRALVA